MTEDHTFGTTEGEAMMSNIVKKPWLHLIAATGWPLMIDQKAHWCHCFLKRAYYWTIVLAQAKNIDIVSSSTKKGFLLKLLKVQHVQPLHKLVFHLKYPKEADF